MKRVRLAPLLIAIVAIGCSSAPGGSTSPAGSAIPSATPAATRGATPTATPAATPAATVAALDVTVLPPEEPREPRTAVAGQRCIFLLTIQGGDRADPIEVKADADGARIEIAPPTIEEGTVAEVTVIPAPVTADATVPVTITVRRGGLERVETRTVPVWPETDTLEAEARGRLATFTAWLATERPDLGITPETAWTGTALQTRMLVVSHYLFLSDDWEAALEWHVMIAPHDWSRIVLRRRWVEDRPSAAFEIASVSGGDQPREIEPPADVIR